MASHYSVIQYLPNPINDERINIGVIAYDEEDVVASFLTNWKRVKCFAGEDIKFIQQFIDEIKLSLPAGESQSSMFKQELTGERIKKMAETWRNTIQLTTPRGSLDNAKETLEAVCPQILVGFTSRKLDYRTREAAMKLVGQDMRKALEERAGRDAADSLVKTNFAVPGKHTLHKFDGALMNGKVYCAAFGLSFELPEGRDIDLWTSYYAWAISDVLSERTIPIGVLALSPKSDYKNSNLKKHQEAKKIYQGLGADFLDERTFIEWSAEQAEKIPSEVILSHQPAKQ